ncbi:MAG: non-ribosomal peptide synthetase, partial [Chloroflexi bacterium]|nr:non-ribosomal peptide synthetase [Chloroflexota bacterium]
PSTLAMLPPAALPALHTITVAGEVCPPELVERWAPGRRFFNLYGPTEATIWTSYALCAVGQPPHIGRPIANTEAYILDRHGQPVPIGVAGELYLGGIGLARGYGNRPDLTAARFVPNPFSSVAGSRLYRTGDLACYRADGNIEFLGRIDHQVKLRGLRIELGEIEAALRQHPALAEAVVLVREDTPGDQSLVAYVTENLEPRTKNLGDASDGSRFLVAQGAPGSSELRAFLAKSLPAYMVPNSFVRLDEMPLTPSGKIDRSALLSIQSSSLQLQSYTAPQTPVEEVLVSIWTEVLKLPPRADLPGLGVHDHFFTLGGHSLLAMQVIFRAHEVFQVDLTLQHLFEAPTIHQFAEVIEKAKRSTVPLRTPAIARLDRSRHVKRT